MIEKVGLHRFILLCGITRRLLDYNAPMRQDFILTAVGQDRPGIVADLAELIFQAGCNLENSSMVNLGSEFATMVKISGQGEGLTDRLRLACKHLEYEKNMTIFIKPITAGATPATPPDARPFLLKTMGEDKAGIVARTARAVSDSGGNILELNSHLRPAAGTGTLLYEMEMRFDLPGKADVNALRKSLDVIESTLHIDIDLNPA